MYQVERLSQDNMHFMKELFKKVFKSNVTDEYLQKKYDTSYLEVSHLGYLAFKENVPVAYAGYIPYRLNFGNGNILAVQSVDSMVTQEVRGTGVFKLLQEYNMQLLKSVGIKMIFGFANQNSEPVFKKMGWLCDQRMKVSIIKTGNIPFSKIKNKLGIKTNPYQKLNVVNECFENPLRGLGGGYVPYDIDFLKYKSFSGARVVLLKGVKVWLKINTSVQVGSVEDCSKEKFLEVLEELKGLTQRSGLNEIVFQFSPGTKFTSWLSEIQKPIEGCAIVYQFLSENFGYKTPHFANADIDTF